MAIHEEQREDYYVFLDNLRESGITNMYGAGPYLKNRYKHLSMEESHKVLADWMESFSDRHREP